jgi:hypothetical protein
MDRHKRNVSRPSVSPERSRKLTFECLEDRILLVFRAFAEAGGIRFEGDWQWNPPTLFTPGNWERVAHDDEIHAIYIDAALLTVHYITKDEVTAAMTINTGWTLGVTFPLPIELEFYGWAGKDKVDVYLGGAPGDANLGRFPVNSVSRFEFFGHEGDDTMVPPEGPAGIGPVQRVIYPAAGVPPNIYFNGGEDNDTLFNMMDPEEFDGFVGWDTVTLGGGGGGGNDFLKGWEGTDKLDGGLGDDVIDGGTFHDILKGNDGNDTSQAAQELTSSREAITMTPFPGEQTRIRFTEMAGTTTSTAIKVGICFGAIAALT